MSVLTLILILVALAVIYWLVNHKFPAPNPLKLIVNIVLVVVAVLLVLTAFGVWQEIKDVKVPKL